MDRRNLLKLGGLTAAATVLGFEHAGASPSRKLVLKATDVHPLGYPTVEAVVRMGKKLETATGGRLSIQMYPSMQLGGEKEMIEQAQVGALQIARISVGPMGPLVPELNVFNLPFMFRDDAHMEKVIDGPIGDEMLKKLSDHPTAGLIGLCWMNGGTRNVYNSKHPVKSVADLKGLKIRMMGNPVFVDTMNALGGNGVAMGYDQLVSALQSGVVDGAENNEPSYETGQHYRYAKYYSLTGHLMIPELLVFSKRTWTSLSPDDQALITKSAKEAQQEQRKLWYEMEQKSLAKMKEAGVEINDVDDKKAFVARGAAGVGQVRRAARRADPAHPGCEVSDLAAIRVPARHRVAGGLVKAQYIRAMDAIHAACLFVAGSCLVVITVIVPYGVFTRYVLNSAASWPEPMAMLLMIVVSFLSAVVCYREYLHIGVGILPALLGEPAKSLLGWFLEVCMLATNLFMLVWGIKLVQTTWYQSIAEFPIVSAGMAYLPIPIGGALTILFVIERLLTRKFFAEPEPATDSPISTE